MMGATAFDSVILGNLFGTETMRRIFLDQTRAEIYLDVEAALARVEARLGIIPAAAADEISAQAKIEHIDLELLQRRTEVVCSPVIPVVEQLIARCDGDLGQYVHWGATTQDITDTATMVQTREALTLVDGDLRVLSNSFAKLARRYRDTPMAGRSMLQHAVPR